MSLRDVVHAAIDAALKRDQNCAACRVSAERFKWAEVEKVAEELREEFAYSARISRMEDYDYRTGKAEEFFVLRVGFDGDPDVVFRVPHSAPKPQAAGGWMATGQGSFGTAAHGAPLFS